MLGSTLGALEEVGFMDGYNDSVGVAEGVKVGTADGLDD